MFEYAKNPAVTRFLLWDAHINRKFTHSYLKFIQSHIQDDGSVRYVDNEVDIAEEVAAEIAENANKEELIVEDIEGVFE